MRPIISLQFHPNISWPRKAADLDAVKKAVKEDPSGVMRQILQSLGGEATVQQISEWLIGDIFDEAAWKRWWESTKRS